MNVIPADDQSVVHPSGSNPNSTPAVNASANFDSNDEINHTSNTFNTNPMATNINVNTITTYVDDHENAVNAPINPSNPTSIHTMDVPHDIIEFLERPVNIKSFDLTSSADKVLVDVAGGNMIRDLVSIPFPSTLVANPAKLNKLQNFEYLKADIRVKVLINASPVVTGKFLLTYSPYETVVKTANQLRNQTRTSITAYPNIELDPQLDTAADFIIPYLGYTEAYSLTGTSLPAADYVTLYLYSLTEIRNISEDHPISFQFFANFENIELTGPTVSGVNPKFLSERERLLRKVTTAELRKIVGDFQVGRAPSSNRGNSSGAMRNQPKNNTGKGREVKAPVGETKGPGLVQEIASGVSGLAESLGSIPIISDFAKPVKWVSDVVGGVASIFGWSKPATVEENCKLTNVPGFGMTHIKGIDESNSLAMNQDYQLGAPLDVFQTNEDEMSIEYVCNNPAVIGVYTWDSSVPFAVDFPVEARGRFINDPKSPYIVCTPFEYVATMFQFYRATICYKFSVAKSAFHSGRLEFTFSVGNSTQSPFTKDTDTSVAYRAVLDVTNDTEIVIRVPYILNKYFGDVSNDKYGYLQMKAITPLISSASVENKVDIVVRSWAENVMFTNTVTQFFDIYEGEAIQKGVRSDKRAIEGELQISLTNKSTPNVVTFCRDADESELNKEALLKSSGDAILNLRSLCKIHNSIGPIDADIYYLGQYGTETRRDFIAYIGYLYKMQRGGFRYKALVRPSKSEMFTSSYSDDNNVRRPYHVTFPALNPVHEISAPYYSPYRRLVTNIDRSKDPNAFAFLPNLWFSTNVKNPDTADKSPRGTMFRAGDDDFSYGWLIGPPPIYPRSSDVIISSPKTADSTVDTVYPWDWSQLIENITPNTLAGLQSYLANVNKHYPAPIAVSNMKFVFRSIEPFSTTAQERASRKTAPFDGVPVFRGSTTTGALDVVGYYTVSYIGTTGTQSLGSCGFEAFNQPAFDTGAQGLFTYAPRLYYDVRNFTAH